jgi:hypothetical protein
LNAEAIQESIAAAIVQNTRLAETLAPAGRMLEALRFADERAGRPLRASLGGPDSPAMQILCRWLAPLFEAASQKMPEVEELIKLVKP